MATYEIRNQRSYTAPILFEVNAESVATAAQLSAHRVAELPEDDPIYLSRIYEYGQDTGIFGIFRTVTESGSSPRHHTTDTIIRVDRCES